MRSQNSSIVAVGTATGAVDEVGDAAGVTGGVTVEADVGRERLMAGSGEDGGNIEDAGPRPGVLDGCRMPVRDTRSRESAATGRASDGAQAPTARRAASPISTAGAAGEPERLRIELIRSPLRFDKVDRETPTRQAGRLAVLALAEQGCQALVILGPGLLARNSPTIEQNLLGRP